MSVQKIPSDIIFNNVRDGYESCVEDIRRCDVGQLTDDMKFVGEHLRVLSTLKIDGRMLDEDVNEYWDFVDKIHSLTAQVNEHCICKVRS